MNFSSITLSLLVAGASAFAPAQVAKTTTTTLNAELNGWVPDGNKFAWGLPGSIAPIEDFDPAGFADGADLETMKNYREAETQHGRIAMLAVVGLLVTEEPIEFHPLFEAFNKDIGPAIRHLDEVRAVSPFFFEALAVVIGVIETSRALVGWTNPDEVLGTKRTLKSSYYPGDIKFDPLTLKPSDAEEFAEMSTKELQNGRLAMLGIAGLVAQELVNGKEIFVNLGLAADRFDPASLPVNF
jgi:light-harvesting complex I chlorophyll a/b binding protein 1